MRSFRSKPVGWCNESYRHYLAAKGMKSKYFVHKLTSVPYLNLYGMELDRDDLETLNRYQRQYGDSPQDAVDRLKAKKNFETGVDVERLSAPASVPTQSELWNPALASMLTSRQREKNELKRKNKDEFEAVMRGEKPGFEGEKVVHPGWGQKGDKPKEDEDTHFKKFVDDYLKGQTSFFKDDNLKGDIARFKEEEARRSERGLQLQEEREEREKERGGQYEGYLEAQKRDMRLRHVNQKIIEEMAKGDSESAVEEGIRNTKLYELRAKKEALEKEEEEE